MRASSSHPAFVISAGSLFMMTGWALGHGLGTIVLSGLIQGLGIGLTFVPLQVLAFGTLPPSFRTEAAAVLNLTRNIGSSSESRSSWRCSPATCR